MANSPVNLRVVVQIPFPARVAANSPIKITKANGIYTISFDVTTFGQLPTGYDPFAKEVIVYDPVLRTWVVATIAQLIGGSLLTRTVTAAGDVNVLANDRVILMNKTVGAATNINLPTANSRNGFPLTVKDFKGDASINNITFVPNGAEKIDGKASVQILDDFGALTLNPISTGGWWRG